jgi:hypothetical protein
MLCRDVEIIRKMNELFQSRNLQPAPDTGFGLKDLRERRARIRCKLCSKDSEADFACVLDWRRVQLASIQGLDVA